MTKRNEHEFDPITLRCEWCGVGATAGSVVCSPHSDYLDEDGNDIRRVSA